jgi:hypothetical protein
MFVGTRNGGVSRIRKEHEGEVLGLVGITVLIPSDLTTEAADYTKSW